MGSTDRKAQRAERNGVVAGLQRGGHEVLARDWQLRSVCSLPPTVVIVNEAKICSSKSQQVCLSRAKTLAAVSNGHANGRICKQV